MAKPAALNRGNNDDNTALKRRMAELLNSAQQEAQTEMYKEIMRLQAANDAMTADFEAANEPMGSEIDTVAEREHGKRETSKNNPINAEDPDQKRAPESTSPFASPMQSPQTAGQSDDLMKGDMRSSIIPDEEPASTKPPEVTPEVQNSIEVRQQEARQQAQTTQQMQEVIAKGKTAKMSGQLLSGTMSRIIKRIPGAGALLSQFKGASLPKMIKILEKLKRLLNGVKKTAGITEGIVRYAEVMGATIETIIVPILMLLIFPFYLLFLFFFPEFFSKIAKTIDKVIERLNKFLVEIKKMEAQQRQKKEATARLENIKNKQLDVAANQPMQGTAEQKAA
jgi:hypothetical protein